MPQISPLDILQVSLLQHGSLDAGLHLERLSAILQALWIAAQHAQAEVRPGLHVSCSKMGF